MSAHDDEVLALLREAADQWDAEALEQIEFHERVKDLPGPAGALLRQIAHAHNEYEDARTQYGTTEGEPRRWMPVVDEAVALARLLVDGGEV
jgi:hypothetical protein